MYVCFQIILNILENESAEWCVEEGVSLQLLRECTHRNSGN